MPIYVFHCKQCDTDIEKLVKMDTETVTCEGCGKEASKMVTTSAFKGNNGFYSTKMSVPKKDKK